MKKILSIVAVLAVASSMVMAGWNINDKDSFIATGNAAKVTIPAGNGAIVDTQMSVWLATNQTITIDRAELFTAVSTTNSASVTNIVLYTTSSNKVSGYTLTTSDSILVADTKNGQYTLSGISSIGTGSNLTAYTLGTSVSFDVKDTVFICKNADKVQYTGITTNAILTIKDAFVGKQNSPVHIGIADGSGSATIITGTYSVEK